jgi:hypothetical protein
MKERQPMRKPQPEPGSVKATLYPLDFLSHELTEPSFTRHFPDMQTYERVRKHLQWEYIAIEVWTGNGQQWQPDAEHTIYTGLWRGEKITDPPNTGG